MAKNTDALFHRGTKWFVSASKDTGRRPAFDRERSATTLSSLVWLSFFRKHTTKCDNLSSSDHTTTVAEHLLVVDKVAGGVGNDEVNISRSDATRKHS